MWSGVFVFVYVCFCCGEDVLFFECVFVPFMFCCCFVVWVGGRVLIVLFGWYCLNDVCFVFRWIGCIWVVCVVKFVCLEYYVVLRVHAVIVVV